MYYIIPSTGKGDKRVVAYPYTIMAILFRPLGLLASKTFKIIWLSNLSTLSVHDEAYSRNSSCTLNLISTFVLLCM